MKCTGCGIQVGMYHSYKIEGKKFNLCIDCAHKNEQINQMSYTRTAEHLNYITAEMAHLIGVPDTGPKYKSISPPIQVNPLNQTTQNFNIKAGNIGVLNSGSIQNLNQTLDLLGSHKDKEIPESYKKLVRFIWTIRKSMQSKRKRLSICCHIFLSKFLFPRKNTIKQ